MVPHQHATRFHDALEPEHGFMIEKRTKKLTRATGCRNEQDIQKNHIPLVSAQAHRQLLVIPVTALQSSWTKHTNKTAITLLSGTSAPSHMCKAKFWRTVECIATQGPRAEGHKETKSNELRDALAWIYKSKQSHSYEMESLWGKTNALVITVLLHS